MRIDGPAKEIILKVVYYGPGMAGKTTNLTIIHDRVPSNAAGDLQVVDTHSERTLRFDLLGVDVGQMLGHALRFDFFTVPGQSYYAATRRAVLAGTDGVVFVADSRREALDENIEAMNEMLNSLRHHGLPEDLPVVIQYNKQDLPTALKPEQLEPLLNVRGWPSRSSVARDGTGVMETMQDITRMTREWASTSEHLASLSAVAPVVVPADPPATWLISCYRCQAMLEVPDAKVGSLYACGVCSSQLEVYEPERGLTRAPAAAPKPVTGRIQRDDSDYGLQTISDQKGGALGTTPAPNRAAAPGMAASGAPFEVTGYDLVDLLDENPLARRARVRERATGRQLRALTINPVLLRQPGYSEALEPHVRLASQIKHPYILPLAALQANKEAAVIFSNDATDYEHLGFVLARRRALAPPHAMGILRQVALGLEEAARHGVVHGWLRPEIILVNPEGGVLIDELAFPKNHRFLVRELSGASAATEYYLAPEHINGESRSDVRSDIFMLGALLFRMFTGEGLVTGYNAHEALHKIVANGARSLRSVQSGISRELEIFYQRLVTTERKDRYQTYRELIDALDQFGGGAKRQTMRLTQHVALGGPGQNPGTGTVRRPGGTTQFRRPGTTEFPRPSGSPTTATLRAAVRPPDYTTSMIRKRKPDRSGAMIGLVMILAVLVGGGLVAMIMFLQRPTALDVPPPVEEKNQPRSTSDGTGTGTGTGNGSNTGSGTQHTTNGTQPVVKEPPKVTEPGSTHRPPVLPVSDTPTDPPPNPSNDTTPTEVRDEHERVGVAMEIGRLEREKQFKKAMDMCDRMPTPDERQSKLLHVAAMHEAAKREVENVATTSVNLLEITALLDSVRDTWGIPDDSEWASALLVRASTRLANQKGSHQAPPPPPPPPPPTGDTKPGVPPGGATNDHPTTAIPDTPERITALTGQIIDSLAMVNYPLAVQQCTQLAPESPEAAAFKRVMEVWSKRGEIIGRAISGGAPVMHVTHPATNEQWDITQAGPDGLVVSISTGSSSSLAWNQVKKDDLARVCSEMAGAPTARPEAHDLAVVMQLIVRDALSARSEIKKAKSAIEPRALADYEVVVTLQLRRDALTLVEHANAALLSGNSRALTGYIEQLKHVDKSVEALIANDLARLQGQSAPVNSAGGTNPGDAGSKDHLGFKTPDDINAFSERSGMWQIANGSLTNGTDGAKLVRHDLKDARTANLIYVPLNKKGTMLVEFRGARMILDFSTNTYSARSHDEELKTRTLNVLAKAANSMYFEVKANNIVTIEMNNGVDSVSLKGGDLLDTFSITLSSGESIALQDLQITRSAALGKPAKVDRQQELRNLGLEPLGNAYLDSPAIVLPLPTAGSSDTSGIAMMLRENIIGATFEAKGSGTLRIQLGTTSDRTIGDWVDVPLHGTPTGYKVTWSSGVINVIDSLGAPLGSKVLGNARGYLMISTSEEATVLKTPVLIHQ